MTHVGNTIPHSGFGVTPPHLQLVATAHDAVMALAAAQMKIGLSLWQMNPFFRQFVA